MQQELSELFYLVLIGSCLLGGGWVWWRASTRWRAGQPVLPSRDVWRAEWNPFAALLPLAWVAMQLLPGEVPEPSLETVKSACLFSVVLLAIFLMLLCSMPRYRLSDFGIDLRQWKPQITHGAAGFLASMLPVLLIATAAENLGLRTEKTQHVFLKTLASEPSLSTIAWLVLAVVVLAPLTEELIYRVALQGSLRNRLPSWAAIAVVAVIFCIVHGFADALPLLPLALILGYIYDRRHSYLAVVVTHALFNATFLILAILQALANANAPLDSAAGL